MNGKLLVSVGYRPKGGDGGWCPTEALSGTGVKAVVVHATAEMIPVLAIVSEWCTFLQVIVGRFC